MMMDDSPIHKLRVINRNDFTIRDRYDGVPYVFEPNVSVDLSLEAARHIIGYPAERDVMNLHMAKRWGWNRPEHVVIDPLTRMMKFQEYATNVHIKVETFEIRRVVDSDALPRLDDLPEGLTEDQIAEARYMADKPRKWVDMPAAPGERG